MITLYARRLCPYCMRVERKLKALDLDYEKRHVSWIPPLRSAVAEISGQTQVPVIVDPEHGIEGMNESGEIIAYLEETYGAETS
jgi:glutaredoxin 3